MNDSGFELSGIRQLILQVTGIDVISIHKVEKSTSVQDDDSFVLINFTSMDKPEKQYQTTMSLSNLNKLCESDLGAFKDYMEKLISD